MKTAKAYYIDTTINKQRILDQKTEQVKCVVCPQGKNCPHAHNPIELEFTKLGHKMSNLTGVIKAQTIKLKNDKPIEPWRPCANNFSANDLPDKTKKKKHSEEENDDKKDKRKSILERENVFRKPYEKE